MPRPADFQGEFASAVRSPDQALPAGVSSRPGADPGQRFNLYRNNHVVGLADALSHTFPVVRQLVGEEFFRTAAMDHVREHPPESPVLLLYGECFPDFLSALPGLRRYPYVADVARLEWTRIFALNAADMAPIPVQALSAIPPDALGMTRFTCHPSLRVLSSRWPVLSIWQDCQADHPKASIDMDRGESLMVVRPASDVVTWMLSPGEQAFLESLCAGKPLGEAAEAP